MKTLCFLILSLFFAHVSSPVLAGMTGGSRIYLDFRKPNTVSQEVILSDPTHFAVSEKGLVLKVDPRDGVTTGNLGRISRDLHIQTRKPFAVGWAWRPVYDCHITATKLPTGRLQFGNNSVTYPSGAFYARYSPDAVHWSNWQYLELIMPESRGDARQKFEGTLRVPDLEREVYLDKLAEYQKMDVPWGSDEEAAVKWILEKDPRFFEKHLPFIGYVQLLYEQSLAGDDSIEKIEAEISYSAGGISMIPKDEAVMKEKGTSQWRFKAQGDTSK